MSLGLQDIGEFSNNPKAESHKIDTLSYMTLR